METTVANDEYEPKATMVNDPLKEGKLPEPQERYFVIKLSAMRDKTDIEQPVITVGNKAVKHQRIQFKRQAWVPVTGSHVEVLRNTKHTIWITSDVEGTRRKTPQERVRFPIDETIEITEEGYKVLRQKVLGFTDASQKLTEADIAPYTK